MGQHRVKEGKIITPSKKKSAQPFHRSKKTILPEISAPAAVVDTLVKVGESKDNQNNDAGQGHYTETPLDVLVTFGKINDGHKNKTRQNTSQEPANMSEIVQEGQKAKGKGHDNHKRKLPW